MITEDGNQASVSRSLAFSASLLVFAPYIQPGVSQRPLEYDSEKVRCGFILLTFITSSVGEL